jgi:hypothetical protein
MLTREGKVRAEKRDKWAKGPGVAPEVPFWRSGQRSDSYRWCVSPRQVLYVTTFVGMQYVCIHRAHVM